MNELKIFNSNGGAGDEEVTNIYPRRVETATAPVWEHRIQRQEALELLHQ